MSPVKTAVVGLNMGAAHAHAYHLSDKADLRWVVDLDLAKAEEFAAQMNCRATTDWRDTLADVEAISFATPHHLHYPQGLEALQAGKHVLMEKPLANTPEQCEELIRLADEKNLVLMLAYIVRFREEVKLLKKLLESGEYGEIINANCYIEGRLAPAPGQWFASKEKLGGGVLFSHGCHYIDLLIHLLGKPVRVAGLSTRKGTEWMEGDGTSHALIKFESGALGHLISSWGLPFADSPALLHVHTTKALFILNWSGLEIVDEEGRRTVWEPDPNALPNSGALAECEHFLDCIREGKKPWTGGHEAMISHRVIWAIDNQNGVEIDL